MPVQSEAEPTKQPESTVPPAQPRLRWRAVIHASKPLDTARGGQSVAWHLADCDDPTQAEAHCDIGRHLIATDGNPDGHCKVGGVCPRCPEATTPDTPAGDG